MKEGGPKNKDTQEVRQKILHLAAEVAETDDNNVPVLLLQLREILDECPPSTEVGQIVRSDLWTYDVTPVCNLALKQDFSTIEGFWETASHLSCILCRCCIGLERPGVPEYQKTFLPDVVQNILALVAKLHDQYLIQKRAHVKKQCFQNFKASLNDLERLTTSHVDLIPLVLQSKRFMQVLMSEDVEASLFVILVLESLLKTIRDVVVQLGMPCIHTILDEMIFKISASKETAVGRSSIHLILTAAYRHPSLVNILLSSRYRGLKAYLSKWRGRGFDIEVKRLVDLLEAGTAARAEQMRLARAASVIQAFYRGYRQRLRLGAAERGIVKFQRLFRQRRLDKAREKLEQKEEDQQRLLEERRRIGEFRSSMRKQLRLLESVPAREVNRFLVENQADAVTRLQAGYRGMVARRKAAEMRQQARQRTAAVTIQRQFRRYKQRQGTKKPTFPVVPGLTDQRRVELQNLIVERREKYPPKHRSFEEQKELHDKAQKMLSDHVMYAMKSRKNEQRRAALLARLQVDADQLLSAPKLHDATPEMLDAFKSRSAPVMAKAQRSHKEDMRTYRLPWWKKLWEEDSVDPLAPKTTDPDLELNF